MIQKGLHDRQFVSEAPHTVVHCSSFVSGVIGALRLWVLLVGLLSKAIGRVVYSATAGCDLHGNVHSVAYYYDVHVYKGKMEPK